MDSINRNQPEKNHEDLRGGDAVKQIKTVVKQSDNCFFCTAVGVGESGGVRPMNVRRLDDDGTLWFLSASDSHKNLELEQDAEVRLFFQGGPHSDFMELEGTATVSRDRDKIEELWQPVIRTWFTEGVDDPRITVIRVTPTSGYYWDTRHGMAVAGVKMMIGMVIGKTLDDSVEGTLRV